MTATALFGSPDVLKATTPCRRRRSDLSAADGARRACDCVGCNVRRAGAGDLVTACAGGGRRGRHARAAVGRLVTAPSSSRSHALWFVIVRSSGSPPDHEYRVATEDQIMRLPESWELASGSFEDRAQAEAESKRRVLEERPELG